MHSNKVLSMLGLAACLALGLASSAGQKKGGGGAGGNLKATALLHDRFGDRITSDGQIYEAEILSDGLGGDFRVSVNTKKSTRDIFLDFSDCTSNPAALCTPPFSGPASPSDWITLRTRDAHLTSIAPGSQQPVRFWGYIQHRESDGTLRIWYLRFDPLEAACNPPEGEGSTQVLASNLGNGTWEIEATGDHMACLLGEFNEDPRYHGRYKMPFKITAQLK